MKAFKEKQYLIFEFEDGKNVKYNLATGESIGKSGKVVKNVCTQLRGYDYLQIIDSFQDENYREFLKFVDKRVNRCKNYNSSYYSPGSKAKNVGTFLSKIKDYSKYEQFFSGGITNIDYPLKHDFSQVPKGLLKLCRKHNIKINDKLIISYIDNPNLFHNLLEVELYSIGKNEICRLLSYDNIHFRSFYRGYSKELFYKLITEHNYKPVSLVQHLDNLITYEAIDGLDHLIQEFYDYVRMMSAISNKYEKYPKNFLTTHKIACRNYNRLKTEFNEKLFRNRINKNLEFEYNGYSVIYPNSTNDIKDEAVQQNNCVASYIDKVIDGDCHILFLRDKKFLDKSLVTLEVRNHHVVQARGKFNREVTNKEQLIIDKYNEKLGRLLKVC